MAALLVAAPVFFGACPHSNVGRGITSNQAMAQVSVAVAVAAGSASKSRQHAASWSRFLRCVVSPMLLCRAAAGRECCVSYSSNRIKCEKARGWSSKNELSSGDPMWEQRGEVGSRNKSSLSQFREAVWENRRHPMSLPTTDDRSGHGDLGVDSGGSDQCTAVLPSDNDPLFSV